MLYDSCEVSYDVRRKCEIVWVIEVELKWVECSILVLNSDW